MPYVPKVGDKAHLVLEGVITQIDATTGAVKLGNAQTGSVNFKPTDGIVVDLQKVPDPEPQWRRNDWVLDADGVVYRRTGRGNWQGQNGVDVFDIAPKRPLTLLVRDGVAQ
jgi:hypothetical protein